MAMCLTASPPFGFSAFVAFGLRVDNPPHAPQPERTADQGRRGAPGRVIDVEFTPVTENRGRRQERLTMPAKDPAAMLTEPKVVAYGPPASSGQAPRLLYVSPPRGRLIEAWA